MRVLVTGPTGTAGSAAVRMAIADPEVSQVIAVSRRPLTITHRKLETAILHDFLDWSDLHDRLRTVDAVVWCLGISQSKVTREQLHTITVDYTLAGATAALAADPHVRFMHLSGGGADPTERSRIPFAKEKGKAENALDRLGFEHLTHFRPAYIHPSVPGAKKPLGERMFEPLAPLMHKLVPFAIVESDDLARAMLRVARTGSAKHVLHNRDIRALAHARDKD